MGVAIGTLIPIGLQTLVLIPISIFLRKNIFLAFIATLISNPITVIPFYLIAFTIGTFFIDTTTTWEMLSSTIASENYKEFLSIGSESLGIIYLGLLIMTITFTALSYWLTLKIVTYARQNKTAIKN